MNIINFAMITICLSLSSIGCIVGGDAQPINRMCPSGIERAYVFEDAPVTSYIIEDVAYISQLPEYPNGCEIISTTMALNYYGLMIKPEDMIKNYIAMGDMPIVGGTGPDPRLEFCGDPKDESGWGCESTVIRDALRKMGVACQLPQAESLAELCLEYVSESNPVIIWATLNMQPSNSGVYVSWHTEDGDEISYNVNQHCMVLVGYDEEKYYFLDPLKDGDEIHLTAYDRVASEEAFKTMGCQSIVISSINGKVLKNDLCEVK